MSRTQQSAPYVGLDVGKAELEVAVYPSGEHWTSGTTASALRVLARRLAAIGPALVVLEATGGYEVPLLGALAQAALPVASWRP